MASRCAYVRAGVGAACTQNVTDPRLGPRLLDALAAGVDPREAIATTVASEKHIRWRQVTAVGSSGRPAVYSGDHALGTYASAEREDCVAAGNMLASAEVVHAVADHFQATHALPIAERLVGAMRAGVEAGGEEGPLHSAGLLVAADVPWPVTDLRVDWTDGDPIAELDTLWRVWQPQQDAYRQRGLDPEAAPGYGVPGDDRPV